MGLLCSIELGSRFCSSLLRLEHEKVPHSGNSTGAADGDDDGDGGDGGSAARNVYNAAVALAFAVRAANQSVRGC